MAIIANSKATARGMAFPKLSCFERATIQQLIVIMKLTTVLLLAFCIQVSAKTWGQNVTISVKDVPLERVFTEIKLQTGYVFFYSDKLLENSKTVSIEATNWPLRKVLDACFKAQNMTYSIAGKVITIKPGSISKGIANIKVDTIPKEHFSIKYRLLNRLNEPIPGATIQVKNTDNITVSDENGWFSLDSLNDNAILIISSVSYATTEISVNKRTNSTLTLEFSDNKLAEVTIEYNTGYQQIPQERATGSFSQPDKQMYVNRVATDIISKLEGITSGLVFNRNPSGVASISVRGRSTILANANPLIIVDNFPYDGDIANINPNDIENITVLKDAAAASIWGVKAGNGVIVVTTKKGKFNQSLKLNVNSNISIGESPDLFYDRNFLNTKDFIELEQFLFNQGYYEADLNNLTSRSPISPVVELLNKRKLGLISASDSATTIDALRNLDIRNHLAEHFYRNAINQQYSINMNGGSNTTNYFVSVGYDKNLSSQKRNSFDRITLNSIFTFAPIKKIEITGSINYIQSNTENNSTVSEIRTGGPAGKGIYPYAQFFDQNGNQLSIVKDYRKEWIDTVGQGKLLNWQYFPITELELSDNKTKLYDTRLNATVRYNIFNELNVEFKYQHEIGSTQNRIHFHPQSYYSRNLVNQYSANTPNPLSPTGQLAGVLSITDQKFLSNNARIQLNFNKSIRQHVISAISGIDVKEIKGEFRISRLYGYNDDISSFINVDYNRFYDLFPSGSNLILNENRINGSLNRFRSYYANASYTFDNRYVLSASGRIDQTNLFGVKTNQKSVPLWSTGLKWNINQEDFYRISWLPILQIRLTYGFNGNLINNGSAYTTASYTPSSSSTQPPYLTIGYPGNPQLRWEKIGIANIGLDFSLAHGRINGSLEYFRKRGKDIIGNDPVPSSTGFASVTANYANIEGKGIDIILTSKNLNKSIQWSTSYLFSYATDKVTKYAGNSTNTVFLVGNPVESIYGFHWAGLDPANGDPQGLLDHEVSKDYATLFNQPLVNQKYIGPANPVYFGGIRNTFSWKRLSISANISYKFGYYFRRNSINYYSLVNGWAGNIDYVNRWQKPGDEQITNVPSFTFPLGSSSRDNFYNGSEILVERGDHIRFQDITVGYEVDDKVWKRLPFTYIKLYLYSNNIGLIWRANKYGIDPDVQRGYPTPRTLSFGANFIF